MPKSTSSMQENQDKKGVSKELLEKRMRNSEAARRCRDKVKQRINTLENENAELIQEKRELYLKFVQTSTMLTQAEESLTKANERIDLLEQRLSQLQKYILFSTQNGSQQQSQTNNPNFKNQ